MKEDRQGSEGGKLINLLNLIAFLYADWWVGYKNQSRRKSYRNTFKRCWIQRGSNTAVITNCTRRKKGNSMYSINMINAGSRKTVYI